MKKHLLSVFLSASACLLVGAVAVQAAQATRIPTFAKASSKPAGAPGSSSEPVTNPLDKPFQPKYTYPGTSVPTNVVPIAMFPEPNNKKMHSVCGAFRINKNWLVTAAHCLKYFGATDTRVSFEIYQGDKGVTEVQFYPVGKDYPANADIYFYRQGYDENSKFGHAEDIALVRLEEKEKPAVVQSRKDALITLDSFLEFSSVLGEETLRNVKKTRKKLAAMPKYRREFFARPLNKYSFFVTPPEGIYHFVQHTGNIFEFRGYEGTLDRDPPRVHVYRFKGTEGPGSHELLWNFVGEEHYKVQVNGKDKIETVHTSGSPVIINGFVVSNTSGPKGKGVRATPLYAPKFHEFLQRSMGKEYPKGLCVTPNIPGQLDKWEPKK